jgi:hypothetical protein
MILVAILAWRWATEAALDARDYDGQARGRMLRCTRSLGLPSAWSSRFGVIASIALAR